MKAGLTGFLLAVAGVALAGLPPVPSVAFGQQAQPSRKPGDYYPTFFKVYSKDGRESLTANCTYRGPVINQVNCNFVNVRFIPPERRLNKMDMPLTLEEALKKNPELAKEANRDPQRFEREMRKGLEAGQRDFCSPSSKARADLEAKINDPEVTPKRRKFYQQVIAACSDSDPRVFYKKLGEVELRTCGVWVDHFDLPFKRIGQGQWFYRQERPGGISNVLKVYELTGDGAALWNLSETRVPAQGSEEKLVQTLWSWRHDTTYELPCDFISHDWIQVPNPSH